MRPLYLCVLLAGVRDLILFACSVALGAAVSAARAQVEQVGSERGLPGQGASAGLEVQAAPGGGTGAPPLPAAPSADAARRPPELASGRARVVLHTDWAGTRLELRNALEPSSWHPVCLAPCGAELEVEAMEARVVAPAMTPSNPFRIEPGHGTARLRVKGGSAVLRRAGTMTLIGGLMVAAGGASTYGYGRIEERDSLVTLGLVSLAMGGLAIVGALPMLAMGSTRVEDAHGHTIALEWLPLGW